MASGSAKKKGRPGAVPEYLYETEGLFDYPYCIWLCSGCRSPYFYPQSGTKHGGPTERLPEDRKYSEVVVGPCWRSVVYGVKCVTPRAPRALYHTGEEPPDEALLMKYRTEARKRADEELEKAVWGLRAKEVSEVSDREGGPVGGQADS